MASCLMKMSKVDLCQLMEELSEIVAEKCTVLDINKRILQSKSYGEEICKPLLE